MKNPAAVALGRRGGQSTSDKKRAAAQENGRKGGRHCSPYKSEDEEDD
jgi:general stress protein YciG